MGTNTGPNEKDSYDKEDVTMNIKTSTKTMRSFECYQKCIERAQKLERDEDPQGADMCCQFHQHESEDINTKKVVKKYETCKLFKYESFQGSVSGNDKIVQKGDAYLKEWDFLRARSVPKGYPRENLKYLLEKPTRWHYLPNFQTRFHN